MSGVPREILRWLQSLDLSYSVRNPRRDLANGFLVAEIFSRYYRHDVSMHSFENSFSQRRKVDNWRCLERLFAKARIPIGRALIDRVLVAEPGAAIQLLKTVYTLLTNKRAPSPEPFDEADLLPPFARPTASVVVKEAVAHDAAGDMAQEQELALKTIEAHEQVLRQERLDHPSRFFDKAAAASTSSGRPGRVAAHVLAPESAAAPGAGSRAPPNEFVKQVVVKQIDVQQIPDLQAALDKTGRRAPVETAAAAAASAAPDLSISAILDGVVQRRLRRPVTATEFAATVAAQPDGAELALGVLADLLDPDLIRAVAGAALQSPAQFWALVAVLGPLLGAGGGGGGGRRAASSAAALAQRSAAQVLAQVGKAMALVDGYRARALFVDFGLGVIVDLIRRRTPVAHDALAAMLCFGPDTVDGRLDMIQRLHDALRAAPGGSDPDLFVGVLAAVVPAQAADFNARSLDLFLYYAMVGLRSASPPTRAAALRIGAAVACCQEATDALIQALDLFEECAHDTWAEVRAALVGLVTAVLAQLPGDGGGPALDRIRHILLTVTATTTTPATLAALALRLARTAHPLARDVLQYVVQSHARVRKALVEHDGVPEPVRDEIRRIDAEAATGI